MTAPFWSATSSSAIDWYTFLARPRLIGPGPLSLNPLRRASILVTGAGGSIGSALSLRLAALCPKELLLLDSSEQALHRLQAALDSLAVTTTPRLILGNVGDVCLLTEIFGRYEPRFVFHAAAYKHVPLLEQHPLEAIANNALNTFTLAECARRSHGARLVLLSTDKAVEPISILGATKRIAELITVANRGVVLRLGNVLGTEGSVSEIFLRQIAGGGPITITDKAAQRYFLTCEEAVDLLLASSVEADDGAILVPALERQYSIESLADFLVKKFAREHTTAVQQIGPRSGDKPCEKLWSHGEAPIKNESRGYLRLESTINPGRKIGDATQESFSMDTGGLRDAITRRDLNGAMEIVRRLVPEYEPGVSLLSMLQSPMLGGEQP